MLDIFNFPVPQNADYQEFFGSGSSNRPVATWVKPRGAGMVMFLLIGGGSSGSNGTTSASGSGGGSGAVTRWIGPAIFVPDVLHIQVGGAGSTAEILFKGRAFNYFTLLQAVGGSSTSGGSATANSAFGSSGMYISVAGAAGVTAGASITASTTTFLSGGASGASVTTNAGGSVNCNYGYPQIPGGAAGGNRGADGFFIKTPLMLGAGGAGGGGNAAGVGGAGGDGGIGCGGGGGGRGSTAGGAGGKGGQSAVFIWSW